MGILDRFKGTGGKDREVAMEFKRNMAHNIVSSDHNKPLTETEAALELGINLHMIEDSDLQGVLRSMSVFQRTIVDDDGNQLMDKKGNPQTDTEFDLNMLATSILTSPLIRTAYADPIDVEIALSELESFMIRQEMELNEDEYELGGTNLLESLKQVIKSNFESSQNGRMAKLLKVTGKAYEVTTPSERKKQDKGNEGSRLL